MRAPVVEDEEYLAGATATRLRHEAVAVNVVGDRASALEQVAISDYDIIILDRDLPVVRGDGVCRRVVCDHPSTRAFMLTTSRTLDARVGGFELGADNYLTKPFELPELAARLWALGRRSQPACTPVLEAHGVRLDPLRQKAHRDGRFARFSLREFMVLQALMEVEGRVPSAGTFLEEAWDVNANPFTSSIRVTVSHLRHKLGEPRMIRTVPSTGCRFNA